MSVKQLSVFLENKPGTLNEMTSLLSHHNINMRALCLSETKDFGIARIIVDNILEATAILREADFIAILTPVLAFEVPNEPGGLNKLLGLFTEAGVNIEYMYSFLDSKETGKAFIIFRVEDTETAEKALVERGAVPLDSI